MSLAQEVITRFGDTPAARALADAERLTDATHAYHLAVMADALALDHEACIAREEAHAALAAERYDHAGAARYRAEADRLRRTPPPGYDPHRAAPVRPSIPAVIRRAA